MAGLASRFVSKRLPPRAAWLSIALHAGLLTALLTIREDAPRISRPDVVHAVVVLRLDGSDTAAEAPATDVVAPEPPAAAESPRPAPETANVPTPAPDSAPPVEPEPNAAEAPQPVAHTNPPDRRPAAVEHASSIPAPDAATHGPGSPAQQRNDAQTVAEGSASQPISKMPEPATVHADAGPPEPRPLAEAASSTAPETPADAPDTQPLASAHTPTAHAGSNAPVSVEPQTETFAMPPKQQAMLSKRFASLTRSFASDGPAASVSWKSAGQKYTATFERQPSSDPMGTDHVVVEVSTVEDGTRFSTKLRMKRLAFSDFAQFVDRWDPDVQIHDDEIDGRFHSNSEITVSSEPGATPIFHGLFTTASQDVRTDTKFYLNRHRMFPAGIETGVRRIALPERFVAFPDGATVQDAQIERFEHDAHVRFYPDGTYVVQYVRDGGLTAPERHKLADPSQYLLASDDTDLFLSGVVNGKVLVYSPDKLVIERDLVYAVAPDTDGADDYLGLVSDRSVEIAEPDVTGPGDLRVDASIYARSRFTVRNYRSRPSGTLIIRGALIAGSVSATEPRYATRVVFDRRLEHIRAPRFPVTDRYELETWDQTWTAEPANANAHAGHSAAETVADGTLSPPPR